MWHTGWKTLRTPQESTLQLNPFALCGLVSRKPQEQTIPIQTLEKKLFLNSIEELRAFLGKHTPLDEWGKNQAKSVENLWAELKAGESTLTHDANRAVRVVVANIRRQSADQKMLVELAQVLKDGRHRMRPPRPMAEKMIGHETPRAALIRGLREELSLSEGQYTILKKEPAVSVTARKSASYPGLMSQYERFVYHVVTEELPMEDFVITEEHGVQQATWGWRFPSDEE